MRNGTREDPLTGEELSQFAREQRERAYQTLHGIAGYDDRLLDLFGEQIARHLEQRLRRKLEVPRALLDKHELARWLNISVRAAQRLLADGDISSVLIGGVRRVDPVDVEAYLRRCRLAVEPGSD